MIILTNDTTWLKASWQSLICRAGLIFLFVQPVSESITHVSFHFISCFFHHTCSATPDWLSPSLQHFLSSGILVSSGLSVSPLWPVWVRLESVLFECSWATLDCSDHVVLQMHPIFSYMPPRCVRKNRMPPRRVRKNRTYLQDNKIRNSLP